MNLSPFIGALDQKNATQDQQIQRVGEAVDALSTSLGGRITAQEEQMNRIGDGIGALNRSLGEITEQLQSLPRNGEN